jgi:hypothetical protein
MFGFVRGEFGYLGRENFTFIEFGFIVIIVSEDKGGSFFKAFDIILILFECLIKNFAKLRMKFYILIKIIFF